ncbi:MAG: PAS domain-containing protein [Magnetospirillum sp.]|nr:PAS domain-containing protein [Magnetospirillum sp.]
MLGRAVTSGRLLLASAVVSAPAMLAIAALAAVTPVDPRLALVAAAAVVAAVALLLRPPLAEIGRMALWVRGLAQGVETPPPNVTADAPLAEMVGAIGVLRRHARLREDELTAAANRHETLFDTLPDPLILLGEGRKVVRINRAACAIFGRDLAGRDLASQLRDPAVLELVDGILAGSPGGGGEVEFSVPVPVELIFRARIEPLATRGADGAMAVLALHDITTVRRMEQMRADFVANASHELRTPLATLLGFIETLRGPARDDAEARERFLAIMLEQGQRMSRLVNDLLSLSRIELNEHSPPAETVAVARIVASVTAALQPLAQARAMTLEVRLDPAAAFVVGQADELTQLLQNLLDNAIKYGREGTAVVLTADRPQTLPPAAGAALRDGPAVRLAVRDHGEGIAREHLPRLTERFYRVDTARSRKLGGTGLGLAIVKHIVNRHRGVLTIDSAPGKGSTFAVILPAAPAPAAAPPSPSPNPAAPPARR